MIGSTARNSVIVELAYYGHWIGNRCFDRTSGCCNVLHHLLYAYVIEIRVWTPLHVISPRYTRIAHNGRATTRFYLCACVFVIEVVHVVSPHLVPKLVAEEIDVEHIFFYTVREVACWESTSFFAFFAYTPYTTGVAIGLLSMVKYVSHIIISIAYFLV